MKQRSTAVLAGMLLVVGIASCGGGGGGDVSPPAPQAVSISISGIPSVSMLPGQSAQLTATLTYSDASVKDVTATAIWGTTDASVLSVSGSGALLAIAPGQADVIASTQELSSRGFVRVAPPASRLTLFAGSLGGPGSADGSGEDSRFNYPRGVAADSAGNLYVADTDNYTIRRIAPSGAVTTLAGAAGQSGSADGPGDAARFAGPWGITTDSAGNVYVADNHTIRKITSSGVASTWVGAAGASGNADGTGAAARFASPRGLATDGAGNIYVADQDNHTIRKITSGGVVTTLAGAVGANGSADGTGADARFNSPSGVAVDGAGNLYVADTLNFTIRRITPAGAVSTLAGSAGAFGHVDGFGAAARFVRPFGAATDRAGNVYVVDGATVRKITPQGAVSTLAGSAEGFGQVDGIGADARFGGFPFVSSGFGVGMDPLGLATDRFDNVYVADTGNHAIRKVTPAAVVSTLAGSAVLWGSADGVGAQARFGGCVRTFAAECSGPRHVAVDGAGNLLVADPFNRLVRKITPDAVVTTLADAAGVAVLFDDPRGVATDGQGNVYVAAGHAIEKINSAGVRSTLAGNLVPGSADGTGTGARFSSPSGLATDGAGNAYVADTGNFTIRKLTPAGVVSTLAGTAGHQGSADGTGAEARFGGPSGVATDGAGNVYVADTGNDTIRRITPEGLVSTLAGTAGASGSVDGTSAAARFNGPTGVATDSAGNVYVVDAKNNTIRKITPAGVVTTAVGIAGRSGFAGNALPGGLTEPYGVAIRGTSLYITLVNGVAVVSNVP